MTARIVQLLSRYFAMGLTAAAGWLGAQEYVDRIGDLSQSLAAAVVAVMLFIVDLLIHKWGTGGVLTPPGTPGSEIKAGSGLPLILLPALLLPLIASGGGCSATPARQTLIALETYISTLNSIATLRQGGFIDDVTALQIESIRKVAAHALDDMDAASQAGDAIGFDTAAAIFNAALDRLIQLQSQAQTRPPESHPSKGTNHDGTGDPDAGPRVRRGSVVLDAAGRTTATRGARPDARGDRGCQGAAVASRTELAGSVASTSGGGLIADALTGCRADVPPAVQVSTHRVACTAFSMSMTPCS